MGQGGIGIGVGAGTGAIGGAISGAFSGNPIGILIGAAVGAALGAGSAAAGLLLQQKPKNPAQNDDIVQTLSDRLKPIPVIFGNARAGGIWIAVGNFLVVKDNLKQVKNRHLRVCNAVLAISEGSVQAMGNVRQDGQTLKALWLAENLSGSNYQYYAQRGTNAQQFGVANFPHPLTDFSDPHKGMPTPFIPWRNTALLYVHTVVGTTSRMPAVNIDNAGPDFTIRRNGTTAESNSGDFLLYALYDGHTESFYYTLNDSFATAAPYGMCGIGREGVMTLDPSGDGVRVVLGATPGTSVSSPGWHTPDEAAAANVGQYILITLTATGPIGLRRTGGGTTLSSTGAAPTFQLCIWAGTGSGSGGAGVTAGTVPQTDGNPNFPPTRYPPYYPPYQPPPFTTPTYPNQPNITLMPPTVTVTGPRIIVGNTPQGTPQNNFGSGSGPDCSGAGVSLSQIGSGGVPELGYDAPGVNCLAGGTTSGIQLIWNGVNWQITIYGPATQDANGADASTSWVGIYAGPGPRGDYTAIVASDNPSIVHVT